MTPPVVPPLSGALDTRHFDGFPDDAVALNDTRDDDDQEAHRADGDGEPQRYAPEDLFGAWDRSF